MPTVPVDGSLQVLQLPPAAPLAVTTPILTSGVTGLYQQQQEFQRPHSFAGWLTNNELMFPVPTNNDNGPQHYMVGGLPNISSSMSPSSTPFSVAPASSKLDVAFHMMPREDRAGIGSAQDGSPSCASVDSSNQMESLADTTQKLLSKQMSRDAPSDKTGVSEFVEGLSKEGLKAFRDARNREKNKRYG
jgi:hypothetical protein